MFYILIYHQIWYHLYPSPNSLCFTILFSSYLKIYIFQRLRWFLIRLIIKITVLYGAQLTIECFSSCWFFIGQDKMDLFYVAWFGISLLVLSVEKLQEFWFLQIFVWCCHFIGHHHAHATINMFRLVRFWWDGLASFSKEISLKFLIILLLDCQLDIWEASQLSVAGTKKCLILALMASGTFLFWAF